MKMNRSLIALPAAAVVLFGCATSVPTPMGKTDLREAQDLIRKIEEGNNSLPSSFTAKISVSATVNGRSFKTGGTASYVKNPASIRVILQDLIFRSTFADILYQSDTLKVYVPIEKSLYVRQKDAADENAASLELNPEFVTMTALGRIPLIKGYSVTKSYASLDRTKPGQVIVLENDSFYQSISMKDGIPDKVRIIAKKGGDKFEAHFEQPVRNGQIFFYQKIEAFSENSGNRFELSYSKLSFDAAIDPKMFTISVPEGTKVVK